MVKKIILFILILNLFNCVTYDPRYMESKTTGERIVDVIILMGVGAGVGISIYEEVR